MADVPQKLTPPEKRSSLAEMAAKAAQRTPTNRPPEAALQPPAHVAESVPSLSHPPPGPPPRLPAQRFRACVLRPLPLLLPSRPDELPLRRWA